MTNVPWNPDAPAVLVDCDLEDEPDARAKLLCRSSHTSSVRMVGMFRKVAPVFSPLHFNVHSGDLPIPGDQPS